MLRGIGGPGREVADCEAYVGTRADTKIGCSHQLGPEESAVGGAQSLDQTRVASGTLGAGTAGFLLLGDVVALEDVGDVALLRHEDAGVVGSKFQAMIRSSSASVSAARRRSST
eukprot:CAMPEP_0170087320 /NCGR_PEP_ID=MMETSP0019_2-20121128/21836_1 /TAXON_ID=98059 /ORGANISM="Dinobryon sp., Strain UTEXLB2267" /LENGTH=113 /DNA_ID=CAMNT_0010304929 /DNA_START=120 /DNA_END=460 /DNA_ORIENTATION=+